MGQAKKRGTQAERIALAQAWDEAHAEKWERERPEREARESIRRNGGIGIKRGNLVLMAALATICNPSR